MLLRWWWCPLSLLLQWWCSLFLLLRWWCPLSLRRRRRRCPGCPVARSRCSLPPLLLRWGPMLLLLLLLLLLLVSPLWA